MYVYMWKSRFDRTMMMTMIAVAGPSFPRSFFRKATGAISVIFPSGLKLKAFYFFALSRRLSDTSECRSLRVGACCACDLRGLRSIELFPGNQSKAKSDTPILLSSICLI